MTALFATARDLQQFTRDAFLAVGTPKVDADYLAQQIIDCEHAGHRSHGMRRVPEYVNRALLGHAKPAAENTIEVDRGALVRLNANEGYGQIALRDATDLAIARAQEHGIAAIALHNKEYAGRMAPYCEQAADAGVATVMFVNDNGTVQAVAPPGGTEPRMSTNPIAAGVPRAQAPHLVVDFATSAVAQGRLAEERDRGTVLPDEWVTPEGHLRPFGGFKGFGLSLIAEALGGALTTGDTVSERQTAEHQGTLIIALDVGQLRDLSEFTAQVEDFIRYVKETPLAAGASPIRMPGERALADASADAAIEVNAATWAKLAGIAAELGLEMPRAASTAG